jgi:hypothetical protein
MVAAVSGGEMTVTVAIVSLVMLVLAVAVAARCFERRIDAAIDRSLPYPGSH